MPQYKIYFEDEKEGTVELKITNAHIVAFLTQDIKILDKTADWWKGYAQAIDDIEEVDLLDFYMKNRDFIDFCIEDYKEGRRKANVHHS